MHGGGNEEWGRGGGEYKNKKYKKKKKGRKKNGSRRAGERIERREEEGRDGNPIAILFALLK